MGAINLAAGETHSCAIGFNNNLYCWGQNFSGQLGDFSNKDSPLPVKVDTLGSLMGLTIKMAGAGQLHTCAIASNNQLYCWGGDPQGQLGDGTVGSPTFITEAQPVGSPLVGTPTNTMGIGRYHSCATNSNSNLFCWGDNTFGQLGDGTMGVATNNPIPNEVIAPLKGKQVLSVEVGIGHSCAITSEPRLYCWGRNNYGQLGNGTILDNPIPGTVTTAANFPSGVKVKLLALNTGADHSCAVGTDNNLYCWGLNASGQLGTGDRINKLSVTPVDISGALSGKFIKQAAVGGAHTCAIASDDKVYCWGDNASGQLGQGYSSNNPILLPTPVYTSGALNGLTIKKVALGLRYSCVIASNNYVYCWGEGINGQLGNGERMQQDYPVEVLPPNGE